MRAYPIFFCFLLIFSCTSQEPQAPFEPEKMSWEDIQDLARGSRVNLMMWQGDLEINEYISDYVVPEVKKRYDIDLHVSNGQGNTIVSILAGELEAGKRNSELDMMWINGETFFQLRQINALYGPFTDNLPNASFIDFENPYIKYDFQQEVDGYECPWGTIQEAIIYDSERVPNPPRSMAELEAWVMANPGRFTIPNEFTGMSLLKAFLSELAGEPEEMYGPFDEEKYQRLSKQLWEYLNRIKPYFWKKGETFPGQLAALHQMFATGELDFSLSMNDCEVDSKVMGGVFPETARAYVLDHGTIKNTHYMGIPIHAPHKAGAFVVINFMISAEAQLMKMDPLIWGDGTILAVDRLPEEWRKKFNKLPNRKYAPSREELEGKSLREPAPEYMIRLFDDFRKFVIDA